MDFPCTANSCIVFTVLLLIMAASCVHATSHAPQLTAISWGGQFYPGAIRRRRSYPLWAFISVGIVVYLLDTIIAYRLRAAGDEPDRSPHLIDSFGDCHALQ